MLRPAKTVDGRPMERLWVGIGALAGLSAVAMAAMTAHGLDAIGPARLQMARNAVQMQGWHALALVACGLWVGRGGTLVDAAGAAFTLGLLLFCGSVYALALGQVRIGGAAPAGGTLLMLGWLLLAVSALRAGR
jgi:uncharacterized membrane protein YgdD (TMEM256/DUF423 family)